MRFPSVLEHDIMESVQAIIAAATLNGLSPAGTVDIKTLARKLGEEIGYENVEAVLDKLYPDSEYNAMLPKMFPVSELDGTPPPAPIAQPPQFGPDGQPLAPGDISTDPSVVPQKPQQKGARPPRMVMNQESMIPRAIAELRQAVRALVESKKK